MEDREEFARLLNNIRFTNFDTTEFVESQFQDVRKWLKVNIPSKLYHYRKCNDNSLDALSKNEIWGSSISTFNDSFECLPYYEIHELQEALDAELNSESISAKIAQLREGAIPPILNQMIHPNSVELLKEAMVSLPDDDTIKNSVTQFKRNLFVYINANMDRFETEFFSQILLAEEQFNMTCLTETNTSSLMWGHYADCHKGFCVEYDFNSVITDCKKNCAEVRKCPGFMLNYSLAPVIYSEKRYNATAGLYSLIMNSLIDEGNFPIQKYYPDMYMPIRNLLTKSEVWSYEKEWRLFKPSGEGHKQHSCLIVLKPSAVYLGVKISSENREKISAICNEQNILCFQMMPNYFSSAFEIKPVDVSLMKNCNT